MVGVSATTFYSSNKDVLALFGSNADLEEVFSAKDRVASAGAVIRKLASESVIFSSMLKEDLLRVSRVAFQSKINEQLRDLQHLDFEAAGMAAFRDSMMVEAKELIKMGAKPFEQTFIKVEFMGQEMTVVIESVHDEWEYRLNATLNDSSEFRCTADDAMGELVLHCNGHPWCQGPLQGALRVLGPLSS